MSPRLNLKTNLSTKLNGNEGFTVGAIKMYEWLDTMVPTVGKV